MLHNKDGVTKEEFYIRRLASTSNLAATDMINYVKSHWS